MPNQGSPASLLQDLRTPTTCCTTSLPYKCGLVIDTQAQILPIAWQQENGKALSTATWLCVLQGPPEGACASLHLEREGCPTPARRLCVGVDGNLHKANRQFRSTICYPFFSLEGKGALYPCGTQTIESPN